MIGPHKRQAYEELMNDVLAEVGVEFMGAIEKHPQKFNSGHEGFAVLDEERDELWEVVKMNPRKAFADAENPNAERRRRMREEAIQVAAMAVRFIVEVCE